MQCDILYCIRRKGGLDYIVVDIMLLERVPAPDFAPDRRVGLALAAGLLPCAAAPLQRRPGAHMGAHGWGREGHGPGRLWGSRAVAP